MSVGIKTNRKFRQDYFREDLGIQKLTVLAQAGYNLIGSRF